MTERLQAELRYAKVRDRQRCWGTPSGRMLNASFVFFQECKKALKKEVRRLEQLVEEQSRTINGLAARNAAMELEVRPH
jgi:hypothetical protein